MNVLLHLRCADVDDNGVFVGYHHATILAKVSRQDYDASMKRMGRHSTWKKYDPGNPIADNRGNVDAWVDCECVGWELPKVIGEEAGE